MLVNVHCLCHPRRNGEKASAPGAPLLAVHGCALVDLTGRGGEDVGDRAANQAATARQAEAPIRWLHERPDSRFSSAVGTRQASHSAAAPTAGRSYTYAGTLVLPCPKGRQALAQWHCAAQVNNCVRKKGALRQEGERERKRKKAVPIRWRQSAFSGVETWSGGGRHSTGRCSCTTRDKSA